MNKRVEKIIEKKGLTLYRVAKDCEIPFTTLYDWKSGKSKPKADKLLKISTYLGVPVEELIE